MSLHSAPPTLREKSTWTPKFNKPANEKIFQERIELFKKWYSAWDENQRWQLVQYILLQLSDTDLLYIHSLLDPLMPHPPPPEIKQDFTRIFPRHLSLKIFSYLDPRSLCRAAQVSWYWKYLSEQNALWKLKCLRYNWFLPDPPSQNNPATIWKRHYVSCVSHMYWRPPQVEYYETRQQSSSPMHNLQPLTPPPAGVERKGRKKRLHRSHTYHGGVLVQPLWKHPSKYPKDLRNTPTFEPFTSKRTIPKVRTQSQDSVFLTEAEPVGEAPAKQTLLSTDDQTVNFSSRPMVPIDAVLRPSLMEKLRLGSPSSNSILLSNINQSVNEEDMELAYRVHKVQSSSPFPPLPHYYLTNKEKDEEPMKKAGHKCVSKEELSDTEELTRGWREEDFISESDSDL